VTHARPVIARRSVTAPHTAPVSGPPGGAVGRPERPDMIPGQVWLTQCDRRPGAFGRAAALSAGSAVRHGRGGQARSDVARLKPG